MAMGFLDRLHRKNREAEFADRSQITVGNEVEFHDTLYDLSHIATNNEDEISLRNQLLLSRLEESYNWIKLMEQGDEVQDSAIQHVQAIGTLGQQTNKNDRFDTSRVDHNGKHPFKYHKDRGSVLEVVQSPAASPKLLIREIMMLKKYQGFQGDLYMHQTVAGIELSEEHTEFMDITAIACAAGFVEYDELTDDDIDKINMGETLRERVRKRTYDVAIDGDSRAYFSYHKERKGQRLVPYPFNRAHPDSVERRSMPPFREGSFINLVRDCTFTYLGGRGIRAVQKPERMRSRNDRALVAAWDEMQNEWNALLNDAVIYNPTNEERFIRVDQDTNLELIDNTTEYDRFLTQVVLESQINPEFRSEARRIVREYQRKVKNIIKY